MPSAAEVMVWSTEQVSRENPFCPKHICIFGVFLILCEKSAQIESP